MSAAAAAIAAHRQILTFQLDAQLFGVDILRVREIRGWSSVTAVPEAPAHVLGVLNLRGNIVPVIDLRARLGLPSLAPTATTVIIVLTVIEGEQRSEYGLVVDAVSDVGDLHDRDIRQTPAGIAGSEPSSVPELATLGERMVLLPDIDGMLGGQHVTRPS